MEFVPIKLKIAGKFRTGQNEIEIEAIEGVGTGLAYHLAYQVPDAAGTTDNPGLAGYSEDETETEAGSENGYLLSQIRSGKCLGHRTIDTPRQARLWLALTAGLTDWQRALETNLKTEALKSGPSSRRKQIERLAMDVEEARRKAILQSTYVEEAEAS